MKNPVLFDIKRLLAGKASLAILIFAPVVILFAFGAVIAPVYFASDGGFNVALLCEDQNTFTVSVIESLVKSEQESSVLHIQKAATLEEGQTMLQNNSAACLIRIPAGFQDQLMSGGKSTIVLYPNAAQPMAAAIIKDVLSSGVKLVNEAQTGVNALYASLKDKIPSAEAEKAYADTSRYFLLQALNKSAVFETASVSPLGPLQPVEYYAAALLVIFLSFSALGLYNMTATDISNGIFNRHLAAGRGSLAISLPRILSGTVFVFLQGIPLLLLYMPVCIKSFAYGGNLALMPLTLLTLGFFVSAFAYLLGVLLPRPQIKAVFLLLAFLLLIGGTVIPLSFFGVFSGTAAYTPFAAALKSVFGAFFFFEKGDFTVPYLLMLLYAVLFTVSGIILTKRRA